MHTTHAYIRALLALACSGAAVLATAGAPETPPTKLDIGAATRTGAKKAIVQDVLPGVITGIRSTMISLAPGVKHSEPASSDEDRVFLVLAGSGTFKAKGKRHLVAGETVAHFPVGWGVEVKASGPQGLDILLLRLTLTPPDREDLAAHTDLNSVAYVKAFKDCEPYHEAIKSAKTISRTLLPKNIVPRMALGTVETSGPDQVLPHRHPMLEQYFLGLANNDIEVVADGVRTPLKAFELFHIPSASNHGADVASGLKLHYVWMDFFQDRAGLEWLNMHKPIPPATPTQTP